MGARWWNTRAGHATLAFGATFATLVAGGFVGMHRLPQLAFARQEVPSLAPPDRSWFPVFFRGGVHLDYTVLWNDFDATIDGARRADVLFVGNSQIQFALPAHELRAFERRSGLSVFTLGLPFGEACTFPQQLIERFDLRPRVVVANVNGFFTRWLSAPAALAQNDGRWTGFTTVVEERLAARVWPVASRLFPSFVTQRPARALLRSSTTGAWRTVHWPHAHTLVSTGPPAPPEADIGPARRFRDAVRARGSDLVLTCVPTARSSCTQEGLVGLAAALGVPMVVPRVSRPLWVTDLAHLCPLSGKRFGRALLRELETLDVVRKIERRKPRATTARIVGPSDRS